MEKTEKELVKITPSQLQEVLELKRNVLVYGKSGGGKTATVKQYAEKMGLTIINYDLAGKLPEDIGGIPRVDGDFYKIVLNDTLKPMFKTQGEGYLLHLDEINQGSSDILNALYPICHPDPEQRRWGNHDLSKCQVVACGNLDDGRDGTVYLTPLSRPLRDRFYEFELVSDKDETFKYLTTKFKQLPQVKQYVNLLNTNNISPRNIENVLSLLVQDEPAISMPMETKIGGGLTAKILEIKNKVDVRPVITPTQRIEAGRNIWKTYKKTGFFLAGLIELTNDEEVINYLREQGLTDEEIAGIIKGGE